MLQSLVQMTIGDKVRLSSGEDAEVLYIDQQMPTRPMVKLLKTEEIVELTQQPSIFIKEMI